MTSPTITIPDALNAFCLDTEAYLAGKPGGPLAGMTFAAKDILDVAGHITGGGNPDWKATHLPAENTAWAVQVLVDAGAAMVGKTITDELTRGIFGENAHYGTPINPRAPGRVPGGSSSGSASAVAGGLVDFALGSDTGGSVRIPSSFCGLFGIRPTHGRIHLDGILLQAPSYDTIGWFAQDVDTFFRVAQVLLGNEIPPNRPQAVVIAEDALEIADPAVVEVLTPHIERIAGMAGSSRRERLSPNGLIEWSAQQQTLQGREAWETAREWLDRTNPRLSFEVGDRYGGSRAITDAEIEAARAARSEILTRMDDVLSGGTFVCLPTAPSPAPPTGQRRSERDPLRARISALTSIAGTIGAPQVNLPLGEVDGMPVGLSLIGPRGTDEGLIGFAREIAAL